MTDNNRVWVHIDCGGEVETLRPNRHDVSFGYETTDGARFQTLDGLLFVFEERERMLKAILAVVDKFRTGIDEGTPVSVCDWGELETVFEPLVELGF